MFSDYRLATDVIGLDFQRLRSSNSTQFLSSWLCVLSNYPYIIAVTSDVLIPEGQNQGISSRIRKTSVQTLLML